MSQHALQDIIEQAVADYGFRLAVMWGTDDIVAQSGISAAEGDVLRSIVVPELKSLPDPVEPEDRPETVARIVGLVSGA